MFNSHSFLDSFQLKSFFFGTQHWAQLRLRSPTTLYRETIHNDGLRRRRRYIIIWNRVTFFGPRRRGTFTENFSVANYWFYFKYEVFIQKSLEFQLSSSGNFLIFLHITQILREIDPGDSRDAESTILTHLERLILTFNEFLQFQKLKFTKLTKFITPKMANMAFFSTSRFS